MKRIGIDVTAAVTQGGGIGRYTRELVRALVRADRENQYHLFSARPPARPPVPDPVPTGPNVRYHPSRLSDRWLYRLWYRFRLPVPVQSFTGPIDLYHSPDFVLPPVRGLIPTLLTVHDLSFVHYPETFTPALVRYLNRVVPWSVNRASHVVADSQATKDDLMRQWNVPAARVTVLYSGVNRAFQPVTEPGRLAAVRARYGLDQTPFLLSVSTIQPRKNFQLLVRAFRPIADRWPHQLVIVGAKGWLFEETLAEVERQGLAGRIHFVGFVADDDLPAIYSSASLFLFPSLYEGFGLTPLEAMACGAPVVVSNASCLPEVVGGAAVLLSPHDQPAWTEAMDRLLADPSERARLVAAGFRQARRFTWQKAAHQLLSLYQTMLSL